MMGSLVRRLGRRESRRGTALIIVLVVVVLLSLAAYSFVFVAQDEYEATGFQLEFAQARGACLSGQDAVIAWLEQPQSVREGTAESEEEVNWFQGVLLEDELGEMSLGGSSLGEAPQGWSYSVVSRVAGGGDSLESNREWQFGLENESAKLNLNQLAAWEADVPGQARQSLLGLPGMTETQADQILAGLGIRSELGQSGESGSESGSGFDEGAGFGGSSSSSFGAQGSSSASSSGVSGGQQIAPLQPIRPAGSGANVIQPLTPQSAGQGVGASGSGSSSGASGQGVDALLEGGELRLSDGGGEPLRLERLQQLVDYGWVESRQLWGNDLDRNYRDDQGDGTGDADQELSSTLQGMGVSDSGYSLGVDGESSGDASGAAWCRYLTVHSAERNVGANGKSRVDLNQRNLSRLQQELMASWPVEWVHFVIAYRQYGPAESGDGELETADSWVPNLSERGSYPIGDVFDLIDAVVEVPGDGETSRRLGSPFRGDPGEARSYLDRLLDEVTVVSEPVLSGRVNVLLAPPEVLYAVPGLGLEAVEAILQARQEVLSGGEKPSSVGWLFTEQVVDLTTIKGSHRYLTLGGDVYRGQVIGFRDDRSAVYRATATFDGTGRGVPVLENETWHEWSRGFSAAQLRGEVELTETSQLAEQP